MEHKERLEKIKKVNAYLSLALENGGDLALLFGILERLTSRGRKEINITATELAEMLHKSRVWIIKSLKKLQELGYITTNSKPSKGYIVKVNKVQFKEV